MWLSVAWFQTQNHTTQTLDSIHRHRLCLSWPHLPRHANNADHSGFETQTRCHKGMKKRKFVCETNFLKKKKKLTTPRRRQRRPWAGRPRWWPRLSASSTALALKYRNPRAYGLVRSCEFYRFSALVVLLQQIFPIGFNNHFITKQSKETRKFQSYKRGLMQISAFTDCFTKTRARGFVTSYIVFIQS